MVVPLSENGSWLGDMPRTGKPPAFTTNQPINHCEDKTSQVCNHDRSDRLDPVAFSGAIAQNSNQSFDDHIGWDFLGEIKSAHHGLRLPITSAYLGYLIDLLGVHSMFLLHKVINLLRLQSSPTTMPGPTLHGPPTSRETRTLEPLYAE